MSVTKKDYARLTAILRRMVIAKADMTEEELERGTIATQLAFKKLYEAFVKLATEKGFSVSDIKFAPHDGSAAEDEHPFGQFTEVNEAWAAFQAQAESIQADLDAREASLMRGALKQQDQAIAEGMAMRSKLIKEGEAIKRKLVEDAQRNVKAITSPFINMIKGEGRRHG